MPNFDQTAYSAPQKSIITQTSTHRNLTFVKLLTVISRLYPLCKLSYNHWNFWHARGMR